MTNQTNNHNNRELKKMGDVQSGKCRTREELLAEESFYDRTEMLIGAESLTKLQNLRIAIFGVGGVGGAAMEALARSGVGHFRLIDADIVMPSNLNRQLIATDTVLGEPKVDVAKQRILSINPKAKVETHNLFILPGASEKLFTDVDYILDCIDTVSAKLYIIKMANQLGIPMISSMGAGNKVDPGKLLVTDINRTFNCKLAKVIRRELKTMGIKKLKVVFSTELPRWPKPLQRHLATNGDTTTKAKCPPASMFFVPVSAGLLIASSVINDVLADLN